MFLYEAFHVGMVFNKMQSSQSVEAVKREATKFEAVSGGAQETQRHILAASGEQ